jgi:outer membrane cobalamin receptor
VDGYDDFGTHGTTYLGTSWRAARTLTLRASGGYGYRVPSFNELFFFPFFGNPDLRPERSWSADLGLDWIPLRGLTLSVTGYYNRYDDLIEVIFAPAIGFFQSVNIARARVQGIELEGSYAWGGGVTSGMDYTYTDTEDLDSDRALARLPAHQGRVYNEWRLDALPLTLWTEVVYRSGHWEDRELTLRTGDLVQINAQLSYQPRPYLTLYVRAENLNDDRTADIYSFGARGAGVFGGVRVELP